MANSNASSPKKSTVTPTAAMPKLDDDLVLNEIISRLPLKVAVQCSVLNKTFYRSISGTAFARRAANLHSTSMVYYCSTIIPKIFTRLCEDMNSTAATLADRNSYISVEINKEMLVLASCKGLLLVYFGVQYSHYIFNPVTGKVMFIDFPLGSHVGIAVDFVHDHAHFKLVSLHAGKDEAEQEQTLLKFSVVVPRAFPGDGPSMVLKSQVKFAVSAPKNIDNVLPAYANGCIFWLGDNGSATVAFDVEKVRPVVVAGPIFGETSGAKGRWFGVAEGSVQFVYALPETIVVCGFDHSREEWGEKHRIPTLACPRNNDFGNGHPVFYDGGRLFFLLRKRGEDGEVFMYDMVRKKWERRWNVPGWTDGKQLYFSFSPSLAKVVSSSDHIEAKSNFVDAFRELMSLFRFTAN